MLGEVKYTLEYLPLNQFWILFRFTLIQIKCIDKYLYHNDYNSL